jgi:hypothetical protein
MFPLCVVLAWLCSVFSAQDDRACLAPPILYKISVLPWPLRSCNALFAFFPLARVVCPRLPGYDLFSAGFHDGAENVQMCKMQLATSALPEQGLKAPSLYVERPRSRETRGQKYATSVGFPIDPRAR